MGHLMKTEMKSLIFFFFILLTSLCRSQTNVYKPFPSTYGKWIYMLYDEFHKPTNWESEYFLNEDVIISGRNYKKVYYKSVYLGALRDSSKVIYYVPDKSMSEYVLYNFNLAVGDSIFHPYGGTMRGAEDTVIVEQVDSIELSDGYHKRYRFGGGCGSTWIEGIGSIYELLAPFRYACLSPRDELECMFSDTTFHYPKGRSTCNVPVEEKTKYQAEIKLSPNPFNGKLIVDCSNLKIQQIIITDLVGNVLESIEINDKKIIEIMGLHAGIYFFNAVNQNGNHLVKKIICSP